MVDGPDSGVLQLNNDGSFNYTPDNNFTGNDVFTYVADNGQNESNVATVTIAVLPVNTPPVAVDDDYVTDEDTTLSPLDGVLINDFDERGRPLDGPSYFQSVAWHVESPGQRQVHLCSGR